MNPRRSLRTLSCITLVFVFPKTIVAPNQCKDLCGSDGTADTLSALPVVDADTLTGDGLWCLLDDLLSLGEDHLDVAWV